MAGDTHPAITRRSTITATPHTQHTRYMATIRLLPMAYQLAMFTAVAIRPFRTLGWLIPVVNIASAIA